MINEKHRLLKSFINITRVSKPIGSLLLLLPCLIGFFSIKNIVEISSQEVKMIILLIIGSFVMRSAGCIINDILDIKFDKNVARTKNRPLASGEITVINALFFLFPLLLVGLVILLQFSFKAVICGIIALVMVVLYPAMKRITFYPQLFLGIVFNVGFLLVILHYKDMIAINDIILYISLVALTFVYDTIYGFQDIDDDIKIGVKSSSIAVQKNPKLILNLISVISFALIFYTGHIKDFGFDFFIINSLLVTVLLGFITRCDFKSSEDCLGLFKFFAVVEFLILISFIVK